MGRTKAALEWHGSTLLRRAVGLVRRSVDGPVVVVRAADQTLPVLPDWVEITEDALPGRGPLEGLAAGLTAIGDRAATAFAISTDMPLMQPAFVRRVLDAMTDEIDLVLPEALGFSQPLAAAYSLRLLPVIEQLLAAEKLRPTDLFECCEVLRLDAAALLADPALAAADPQLESLINLNKPEEYQAAQAQPQPTIAVVLTTGHGADRQLTIRAATLGEALAQIGQTTDRACSITLNGVAVAFESELPLVPNDRLVLTAQ